MTPQVIPSSRADRADTSCLITGLRSSRGAAAEVIRLLASHHLVLLMDLKLALEYKDVAMRPEHRAASGMSGEEIRQALSDLEELAEYVHVVVMTRPLSVDPDDDMVLDAAINGKADAIVTQNTKHFRAAVTRFHIPVLTPSQLLQALREEV